MLDCLEGSEMEKSYDKCVGCGREMTLEEVDEHYNEFKAAVCRKCVAWANERVREDDERFLADPSRV